MVGKVKVAFLILACLVLSGTAYATNEPQTQALAQVQQEAREGNYQLITPEAIRDLWSENPGSFLLVDSRQDWEYQREHIQGAVNLPVTPIWWTQYSPWARAEMKKFLGPDKKRLVVFY